MNLFVHFEHTALELVAKGECGRSVQAAPLVRDKTRLWATALPLAQGMQHRLRPVGSEFEHNAQTIWAAVSRGAVQVARRISDQPSGRRIPIAYPESVKHRFCAVGGNLEHR